MAAKRPGGADVSGESRGEPALWGGAERAEGTAGGGGECSGTWGWNHQPSLFLAVL